MKLNASEIQDEQHFTEPPARYTEASLIKTMEENGIGRPSTYAPTITTILGRDYVRREKRMLKPTELGTIVTDIMAENFSNLKEETGIHGQEAQKDPNKMNPNMPTPLTAALLARLSTRTSTLHLRL